MSDGLEQKVSKLEADHAGTKEALKNIDKTLSKIEKAIEKQNDISTDIRELRNEVKIYNNTNFNEHNMFKEELKELSDIVNDINEFKNKINGSLAMLKLIMGVVILVVSAATTIIITNDKDNAQQEYRLNVIENTLKIKEGIKNE